MPFLAEVMGESSIDLGTKELVIVRVSQLNGCRYCLAAHRPLALESGVAPDHLAAACDEASLESLPDRERMILEWVDRYVTDPRGVDDELVARTLDHVRDDQLIELSILIGATQLLNDYCTAFDVPPQA